MKIVIFARLPNFVDALGYCADYKTAKRVIEEVNTYRNNHKVKDDEYFKKHPLHKYFSTDGFIKYYDDFILDWMPMEEIK